MLSTHADQAPGSARGLNVAQSPGRAARSRHTDRLRYTAQLSPSPTPSPARPPAGAPTSESPRRSAQARSSAASSSSAGCAPETAYRRSSTKNGTPVMPRTAASASSARTCSAYRSLVSTAAASACLLYTHLRAHETPEHLVCRLLL